MRYANEVGSGYPDGSLASRLRLAVVRLNRTLRAQRAGTGVSLTQLSALSTLHKCGALTPGELAWKEGVRRPSMSRVIAALDELGYLRRRPHPTDGRQAIVELSEPGAEFVLADISAREAWLDKRLAELSEQEREVLSRAVVIIDRMTGR